MEQYAEVREIIVKVAQMRLRQRQRRTLVAYVAKTFRETAAELELEGHIIGSDRKEGVSAGSHGSDEAVGVAVLLAIAGELGAGFDALIREPNTYAAAALLRQIVEVEYLAWAFDTRDRDAQRWLRSDRKERETFFSPRKLRAASKGRFPTKDYGYHCEQGGHPVPEALKIVRNDMVFIELLCVDFLGHTGRIWDHLISWSGRHTHGSAIKRRGPEMLRRFLKWKETDALALLGRLPD